MSAYSIEVEGLNSFKMALGNHNLKLRNYIKKGLKICSKKIRDDARLKIVENGTIYKGGLSKSLNSSESETFIDDYTISVGTNLEYAPIIEGLSKISDTGKYPSFEELSEWSKKKLGNAGLGYAIAKKIRERGNIKNVKPFMEPTVEKNTDFCFRAIEEMLDKSLEELVK